MPHQPKKETPLPTYLNLGLLAVVLTLVLFVRIRLLAVPLERDEGEFAYMGSLLLKGLPLFQHAYTMKLPGVAFVYALFIALFGHTAAAIHAGLLIVNLLCVLLVSLLARRVVEPGTAPLCAACFATLSLSQAVLGVFAHATHFVLLFSLAGFLLLFRSIDRERLILLPVAGLCFGVAVTMKQHAALLLAFALLLYGWHTLRSTGAWKRVAAGISLLLTGALIPYLLILAQVAAQGDFPQFWLWTVEYASKYASGQSLHSDLTTAAQSLKFYVLSLFKQQPLLWILALGGFFIAGTKVAKNGARFFLFGLLLFSFAAICPGLIFREHYFVLLLPAAALAIGVALDSVAALFPTTPSYRAIIPAALCGAAIVFGSVQERSYLFLSPPEVVSRDLYQSNPFPEAVQIAHYLKDHTAPSDRIAVLGSEPEIYFYADRVATTGFLYMYGLMEDHVYAGQMQAQLARELEQAPPKYLVMVNQEASWLTGPKSKRLIFSWLGEFVPRNYHVVGVVDFVSPESILYFWDEQAAEYRPSVPACNVAIFRRNDIK